MCIDIYSAYGCFQDTISLSCPNSRTIFITSAQYGQFAEICTHDWIPCCPPNLIADCTESVEEGSPQDWIALKALCDNQTSCEFVNQGGYVASCAEPNVVDYMTVNYQCLPGGHEFSSHTPATQNKHIACYATHLTSWLHQKI